VILEHFLQGTHEDPPASAPLVYETTAVPGKEREEGWGVRTVLSLVKSEAPWILQG